MTPALTIPAFVLSIALMLGAADQFARRLDALGLRLGFPETLLGVLTALAADAPEISSAVTALVRHERNVAIGVVVGSNAFNIAAMLGLSALVAGRVRARHEALELEAFVALWVTAVACALVAHALEGAVGLALILSVAVPYVVLLGAGPDFVRRLPLGVDRARFVRRSFGEPHRRDRTLEPREGLARIVLILVAAVVLIVAGAVASVAAAVSLADRWSVPRALVGVFVLAILTSIPNASTGLRFGRQHRGSALVSETLNSNSINLVAGIAIPATVAGLGSVSGLTVFDLAWLVVMTAVAIVLCGRRAGAGRASGATLVALYVVFAAVQVAAHV
jgi:cation:H+ antiporter